MVRESDHTSTVAAAPHRVTGTPGLYTRQPQPLAYKVSAGPEKTGRPLIGGRFIFPD
jgi:hypothetical protein